MGSIVSSSAAAAAAPMHTTYSLLLSFTLQPTHSYPVNTGKKRYRREKPWDHAGIDHWKAEEWKPEYMPGPLLEESSFATLFPKYREKYLREVWPVVTRALEKVGVGCELNIIEGSMTVRTTRKTSDPYVVVKARYVF